ncbi:MAG: dockerin type I repeat-containing protein [Prevotella sp.]|nr:dockerin type I repeat-containing protein [Prevotella sp.]
MKTKDHNKRTFARRAAMTLLAAVMTTMAWAQDPATIGSISYNAELGAYKINSVENLNDLAVYVSGIGQYKNGDNKYTYSDGTLADGAHDCAGMTFKMTADITFPHKAAGAEGADTEDNFTPIGLHYSVVKPFCGNFDGYDPTDNSSHIISGIRINSDILSSQIGLFGSLGSGARVEGVTLADAVIGGKSRLGGIAGDNKGGTVTHCTVRKSVAIVITKENDDIPSEGIGGIVGYNTKDTNGNLGIISHCTSSVQIGFIPGITRCRYTGGIVGYNVFCSLTDNIAIEATVPGSSSDHHGAIAGFISKSNTGEIARNYYRHCTVAGVENAIGKGLNNNDSDGALPLFSLTVPTGVTATTVTQPIRIADEDDDFYPSGTVFTLSGGLDDLDNPDDDGYMKGYTTTAGTLVGSTTSGFTLTLHGGDATIGTTSRFTIDWADESTGDDADHAYLIYNADQLDLVARRVNDVNTRSTYKGKYYRLMKDINYSTANTDNNYTPIGRQYYPFQGHFDGGGHFVSGIRINRPNDSYLGLFGTINDGSTVSNVIVKDASITGSSYVGCIAGYAGNATLTANYYHFCSCTVGDAATATTGIGCNGADITDNDGALPLLSLTTPTGVTATTVTQPIRIADEDDDFYPSGTVFTLSGGLDDLDDPDDGYMKGYTTTAGTVVGSTTSGFTLTLHGGDATIGTTSRFVIDWADESTGDDADHAYLIYNAEQLDLLARRVNDYKTWDAYYGKYYRLMKDIDYSTSDTDNNYTPIGMLSCPFKGIFDGGGHTVSGIRIHKPGNSYLGLFGYVGEGSTVSNVIVCDARITGSSYVGCIAGYTSNATLTANYYYDCSCTVGDLGTAIPAGTGIGCNSADITDNDGAVPVFLIKRDRSEITIQPNPVFTVDNLGYYRPGTDITLSGQPDGVPVNQYYKYCVDGQDIRGNSFTMPASDVPVKFADSPTNLPCVTLASGITAIPSPLKSDGNNFYYMSDTHITLNGGLPEAPAGFIYLYMLNDAVIEANSFTVRSDNIEVGVSPLLPDTPNLFWQSGKWNDPYNWRGGEVPDAGSDVVICANATVPSHYVADAGNVTVAFCGSITVQDGGQLRLTNSGVKVNMEKHIKGSLREGDNNILLASPMTEPLEPEEVQGLTDLQYHLYYFKEDEETDFWQTPETLENGKGYRYANSHGVQLTFTGHVRPTTDPVSVPLDYTAGKPYAGWNLVGNPFPCAAYVDWEGEVYKLNANGDDFEEVTSRIIAPMEGVLVKATAEGQQVTFIPYEDINNPLLVLKDNEDNTEAIAAAAGKSNDVLLLGRTLYKDGRMNTLCLPFDLRLNLNNPLDGAEIWELEYSDNPVFKDSELALRIININDRVMQAGKPYLVRWLNTKASENPEDMAIVNPLFRGVNISSSQPATVTVGSDPSYGEEPGEAEFGSVSFVGTYAPVTFTTADYNVPFMDEGSTLGACHAYFKINRLKEKMDDMGLAFRGFTSTPDGNDYINDIAELPVETLHVYKFVGGKLVPETLKVVKLYPQYVQRGDVNGDGKVTPADAIMILYHYFGVKQNGFIWRAADLNGDTTISPADAIEALYKYFNAAGARSSSPANPRDPD